MTAPEMGPTQNTHWLCQLPDTKDAPKERAGLMLHTHGQQQQCISHLLLLVHVGQLIWSVINLQASSQTVLMADLQPSRGMATRWNRNTTMPIANGART